jgi:hypothetical protein
MVHLSFRISDKAPAEHVAQLVAGGFTLRPRMLSIETLRSDRWTPAETPGARRKPHDAGAFRGEVRWSDASRRGPLKWQIAARPLTIY